MLHDIRELPEKGDGVFPIIEVLAKDSGDFYLAGSRYMLCATKESDWDFYAEYDDKLYERLIDHGFVELERVYEPTGNDPYDPDPSYRNTLGIMECGTVHIQLLASVAGMRKVRDRIMQTRLQEHIDAKGTTARRAIWNQTIVTIEKEAQAPDAFIDLASEEITF